MTFFGKIRQRKTERNIASDCFISCYQSRQSLSVILPTVSQMHCVARSNRLVTLMVYIRALVSLRICVLTNKSETGTRFYCLRVITPFPFPFSPDRMASSENS